MADSDFLFTLAFGAAVGGWVAWANKPTPKPATPPKSDLDILDDLAALMETGIRHDAFYDVTTLPHSKARLMGAAERVFLAHDTLDQYREFLIVALGVLPLYRVGIGPKPFQWFGKQMTKRDKIDPIDPDVQRELREFTARNEIWWPVIERLQADSKRERDLIHKQVKAWQFLLATRVRLVEAALHPADLTPPPAKPKPKPEHVTTEKVLADFDRFTSDKVLDFHRIYDAKILPHSKRKIFEALSAELAGRTTDEDVDDVAHQLEWLSHFQAGVGSAEVEDDDPDEVSDPKVKKILETRGRDRDHYDERWSRGSQATGCSIRAAV